MSGQQHSDAGSADEIDAGDIYHDRSIGQLHRKLRFDGIDAVMIEVPRDAEDVDTIDIAVCERCHARVVRDFSNLPILACDGFWDKALGLGKCVAPVMALD